MGDSSETCFGKLLGEIEASEKTMNSIFDKLGKTGTGKTITFDLIERKGGTKQELAKTIIGLMAQMQKNSSVMKKAITEIEKSREEARKGNIDVIKLQKDLLDCRTDVISKIERTVGKQLKSYSDAVNENLKEQSASIDKIDSTLTRCNFGTSTKEVKEPSSASAFSVQNIRNVIRSAVKETRIDMAMDRSKNLIFFGLTEPEQESQDQLKNEVKEILEELDCDTVPRVRRLGVGASKANPERPRPVQVTLSSSEEVHEVLKLGKQLKKSDLYFGVYVTLDRTPDQQKKHKLMVEKLKERIKEMPERKFYIKGGEICYDLKAKNVGVDRDKGVWYKFQTEAAGGADPRVEECFDIYSHN